MNIVAFNSEDSFILNYSCLVWSLCGFITTINTQTRLANFFKSLHKLLLPILLVRLILCFRFFHLFYGNSWSLHTSFHDVYFSELSGRFSFFLFNYGAFLFFNFIFFCSSNGRNKLYACFCRHFIGVLKPQVWKWVNFLSRNFLCSVYLVNTILNKEIYFSALMVICVSLVRCVFFLDED